MALGGTGEGSEYEKVGFKMIPQGFSLFVLSTRSLITPCHDRAKAESRDYVPKHLVSSSK